MNKDFFSKLNFFRHISFSKKTMAPAVLYTRFYKMLAMSALALAMVAACIITRIMLTVTLVISFSILAVALFFCAIYYKYCLEQIGYTIVRGKITFVKESLSPSADSLMKKRTLRKPAYYHLTTSDGTTYRLPANRIDDELPMGAVVNIYAPYDVATYERNGITYLVTIWAYELAEEPIEE